MVIRNHFFYSFPFRASYGYLFIALMLLVMSWESLQKDASLTGGVIPEQAIRFRIVANSDSPADQAVKRQIRDAVMADLGRFANGGQLTIEDARLKLKGRLPEIERLVRSELAARGFDYSAEVELGVVPFPTKIYGSRLYPAGDYEALRITLGEGEGRNWWCVLFPAMCFAGSVNGEETDVKTAAATVDAAREASPLQEDPQVKFYVWEMLKSIAEFFKNLFR
ncbi:MAG TPA: stage II sporulation protein R [Paenibacillus sp.]|uniref:stage II sporulation protein R n=1 Tax=Paenibacillus sp. TaxID=58172 RepID=UPI0028D1BE5A|nr:stage II sporulation protein R [Paenibacillus sp.]HUC92613.1 stage II sporulation protein R [Paenibacillus sp.]